jgi:hypothetical protein
MWATKMRIPNEQDPAKETGICTRGLRFLLCSDSAFFAGSADLREKCNKKYKIGAFIHVYNFVRETS